MANAAFALGAPAVPAWGASSFMPMDPTAMDWSSMAAYSPTSLAPAGVAPVTGAPATTGIGGVAGFNPQGLKLGMNMGTAQLALSGLQTLGNLWNSFQANSLAKKAFNFQRDLSNTNLDNSIKSYNTALSDRANSRAFVQGMSPDQAQSYISNNQLSRSGFKSGG